MGEGKDRPHAVNCAELGVHRIVEYAGGYESRTEDSIRAHFVRYSIDLRCVDEDPRRELAGGE